MARWKFRSLHQWDHVACPKCESDLELQQDNAQDGDIVSCANCEASFEVITHPFELRRVEDDSNPTPIHRPAA